MSVRAYIIALPDIVKAHSEQHAYRAYVTESLRMQGDNLYFQQSWADMVDTSPPPKVDTRPCKEIAHDIFSRIRGEKIA